jgi:hypothetical protein
MESNVSVNQNLLNKAVSLNQKPRVNCALLPDAQRPATMRCGFHPLAVRRSAPHNQRIQQTIPLTSKLAPGLAADPRRIMSLLLISFHEKQGKQRRPYIIKQLSEL